MRAVQKSDQFDFLIDILPRDEALAADAKKKASAAAAAAAGQPAAEQAKVGRLVCVYILVKAYAGVW